MYTPEEWMLVKIDASFNTKDLDTHYRVFGSWRGGYLDGDYWRMNSGITSVTKEGDYYLFHGKSGSVYKCHKESYGIRSPHNCSVMASYKEQGKKMGKGKDVFNIIQKMPDIMKMDWLI